MNEISNRQGKTVTLLIPVYNEEEGISSLLNAVANLEKKVRDLGASLEVLFVDNNSLDKTWDSICRADGLKLAFKVHCVRHSRNEGMQRSLLTGLNLAEGDAVVVLQADLQDPIDVIPEMVAQWMNGANYVATVVKRRQGNLWTRFSAWIFYRALKFAAANKVLLNSSDFYLIDKSISKLVVANGSSNPFIRTALSSIQEPDVILNYERVERSSGKSNYNWSRKLTFAVDGLLNDLGGLVNKLVVSSIAIGLSTLLMIICLTTLFILGWRSPVSGWVSTVILLLIVLLTVTSIGSISLALLNKIYRETRSNSFPEISEVWKSS